MISAFKNNLTELLNRAAASCGLERPDFTGPSQMIYVGILYLACFGGFLCLIEKAPELD